MPAITSGIIMCGWIEDGMEIEAVYAPERD